MNWKRPPAYLNSTDVELAGEILRPNKVVEHRDTGEFDPTKDPPHHHQSWMETWWDLMDALVDPTGSGRVTDPGLPPPTYMFGTPITVSGQTFNTMSQAAEHIGMKPDKFRRLVREGRLEEITKETIK